MIAKPRQTMVRLGVVALVLCHLFVVGCGSLGGKKSGARTPEPPERLELKQLPQGVLVSWTPVSGATHYTVFWGVERGQYRGFADSETDSVILSGLTPGEVYYIAVTAWNQGGESGYSREHAYVHDKDKSHAKLYLAKGTEAMARGSFLAAEAYLSASIRLNPDNADAYRQRAILREKLERPDLARSDYSAAEKLFKDKPLTTGRSDG